MWMQTTARRARCHPDRTRTVYGYDLADMSDRVATWPFGQRTADPIALRDTLPSFGDSIRIFFNSNYGGADYTYTPAGRFNAHKLSTTLMVVSTSARTPLDSTVDMSLWHAPELGMPVKSTADVDVAPGGSKDREIKELIGYTLK